MSGRASAAFAVAVAMAVALGLCACGGGKGASRPSAQARELDEIVRLEGARTGAPRLLELAAVVDPAVRRRALIALGRQGDPKHVRLIAQALTDPVARAAAAEALGIIGDSAASKALSAAVSEEQPEDPWLLAALAALGRCGDELDAPDAISRWMLAQDPEIRAAAARALGGLGYRKVALSGDVIERLVEAAGDPDARVRHGVAYALMRAPFPAGAPGDVRAALVRLAADEEAEVRALALRGLGAQGAWDEVAVAGSLDDEDWRVRVQAVRALMAKGTAEPQHRLVARYAEKQAAAIESGEALGAGPMIHPLLEALALLGEVAGQEPESVRAFSAVALATSRALAGAAAGEPGLHLAYGAAHCLATAGILRAHAGSVTRDYVDRVDSCGGAVEGGWPLHERKRLLFGLVEEKLVTEAEAEERVEKGLAHADARVRAAAAAAAVAWLPADWAALQVDAAIGDKDVMVAAVTADALAGRMGEDAGFEADRALAAVTARAAAGGVEPEALGSLLGALCVRPAERWRAGIEAAHASASTVVRQAARECLEQLDGFDPGPGVPSAKEPATPADPLAWVGRRPRLEVETTKGRFVVELDGDRAPWNVATLVALAQQGFYDGTLWHRVVPDFVVQGGDPTGSGWGGPGFTVPAEASQARYLRGAVGIADAGKDTGGSQWFVMHSAAPHLEQRYTQIGQVVEGIEVIDMLLVGDRIVKVTVKGSPRR